MEERFAARCSFIYTTKNNHAVQCFRLCKDLIPAKASLIYYGQILFFLLAFNMSLYTQPDGIELGVRTLSQLQYARAWTDWQER